MGRPDNPLERTRKAVHDAQPIPLPSRIAATLTHSNPKRVSKCVRWIETHERRWQRYLRRFDKLLPPDAEIRTDRRVWEARACRIDISDTPEGLSARIWFFTTHEFQRYELYVIERKCREVQRSLKFQRIAYNDRDAIRFATPAA